MVTHLKSSYFRVMPAREDVIARLSDLGIPGVRDVQLFKFSSCTPAFCIELAGSNGTPRRLVLRGEQQNDLSATTPDERSLGKEIYMLRKIRGLGLNAPELPLDGQIHTVPGYDPNGRRVGEFRFFLMEYVEGIAIDRKIRASSPTERLRLLEQVAAIYARVHSIEGLEYGRVDQHGRAASGHPILKDSLVDYTLGLGTLMGQLASVSLADQIRHFVDTTIVDLCAGIERSDYSPTPRLVLYDGFCGNMLIDGDTINLIDMALAGYFEPVTEFCAFIYPLKAMLLEGAGCGRYWDHFISSYIEHGGTLPPKPLMLRLLNVMFVSILLHQMVYCAESRGWDKRAQVGPLAEIVSSMLATEPHSIDDIINLL